MSKFGRFVLSAASLGALIALFFVLPGVAAGGPAPSAGKRSDVYVVGKHDTFDAPVNGNLQVYGGSAKIRNVVHGDVTAFGGDVTIERDGRIDGNLIYAGGNVTGAEGKVNGRVYTLTTMQGAAATMANTAVTLALLFVWIVVAVVVTLLSAREVRFSSLEVRVSPLYCFALGLVAFTSFVITAIMFSYLVPFVIGIPLLAALAVFAILTKVYGLISVFHAVGSLIAGSRTRSQLASRRVLRGDLAMVTIGFVILGAIRLIPIAGPIAWSCASVFGIGCALATRFGRREPAFLTWRPAEA